MWKRCEKKLIYHPVIGSVNLVKLQQPLRSPKCIKYIVTSFILE